MTVLPVVVSAETDSKMASARSSSSEEASSGTAPTITVVSHSRLTTKKPKRDDSAGARPCVASATASPRPPVNRAEKPNTCQSDETP